MDSAPPDMQLSSIAAYFVKRLSDADQKSLEARMKHLDGTTIRVGSTCLGTDLCVPAQKHTFKRLSLLYNVKVEAEHVFSVESQGYKRSFIVEAHHDPESGKRPSFHIFGDVADFQNGCGHCYKRAFDTNLQKG